MLCHGIRVLMGPHLGCVCVCVARMLLTLPLPGILWVSLWFAPPAVAYSFGDYALLAAGTINFTYFAAIMTTLLMVRAVRYKLNLWVDGVLEVGSCVCGCVAVWWCQIGQVDYRRRKVLFQMFNRLIESRSVVKTDADGNPYAIAVPPLVPLSVTHNIRQLIEARTLVKVLMACGVCVRAPPARGLDTVCVHSEWGTCTAFASKSYSRCGLWLSWPSLSPSLWQPS